MSTVASDLAAAETVLASSPSRVRCSVFDLGQQPLKGTPVQSCQSGLSSSQLPPEFLILPLKLSSLPPKLLQI